MQTAEITVQYVNPPKPGKKWGAIKDVNGVSYWGPPAALALYEPGGTYTLQFKTNEEGFNQIGGGTKAKTATQAPLARPQHANSQFRTPREMAACEAVNAILHGAGTMPDSATLSAWYRAGMSAFDQATKTDFKEVLDDEIPF